MYNQTENLHNEIFKMIVFMYMHLITLGFNIHYQFNKFGDNI